MAPLFPSSRHHLQQQLVQSFYLPPAASNCVENQRTIQINLSPGTYSVWADFIDQNNILHNDPSGL